MKVIWLLLVAVSILALVSTTGVVYADFGDESLRSAIKDVATPFELFTGKDDAFDCTDEGRDGFLDLTLKFDRRDIVEAIEFALDHEVEHGQTLILTIEGELLDDTPIVGEDVIVIRK